MENEMIVTLDKKGMPSKKDAERLKDAEQGCEPIKVKFENEMLLDDPEDILSCRWNATYEIGMKTSDQAFLNKFVKALSEQSQCAWYSPTETEYWGISDKAANITLLKTFIPENTRAIELAEAEAESLGNLAVMDLKCVKLTEGELHLTFYYSKHQIFEENPLQFELLGDKLPADFEVFQMYSFEDVDFGTFCLMTDDDEHKIFPAKNEFGSTIGPLTANIELTDGEEDEECWEDEEIDDEPLDNDDSCDEEEGEEEAEASLDCEPIKVKFENEMLLDDPEDILSCRWNATYEIGMKTSDQAFLNKFVKALSEQSQCAWYSPTETEYWGISDKAANITLLKTFIPENTRAIEMAEGEAESLGNLAVMDLKCVKLTEGELHLTFYYSKHQIFEENPLQFELLGDKLPADFEVFQMYSFEDVDFGTFCLMTDDDEHKIFPAKNEFGSTIGPLTANIELTDGEEDEECWEDEEIDDEPLDNDDSCDEEEDIEEEVSEEEPTLVDVVLTKVGDSKLLLAKRLCDVTGKDLSAVNNLLNNAPCVILTGLSTEEAEFAKEQIEGAGAEVELRETGTTVKEEAVEEGPAVPASGIEPNMIDDTLWICGNGSLTKYIKDNEKLWKPFFEFHRAKVRRIVFKGCVTEVFGSLFSKKFKFSDFPNLREVVLANGIEEIPINGFRDCKLLEKLTLPDTLRKIEYTAFKNCESLAEVVNLQPAVKYGRAFNDAPKLKNVIPAQ